MKEDRALPDAQQCPNCGDPTPGNYCPACGQRRIAHVLSLRRLVADAVEDQFSLSSALPRTLKTLFAHPGLLTLEYQRGRIAHYIPPFRLYLLTSFVFFLTVAIFGCSEDDDGPRVNVTMNEDTVRLSGDTTAIRAQAGRGGDAAVADSAVQAEADSAAARERRRVLERHRMTHRLETELDTFFMNVSLPYERQLKARALDRAIAMADIGDEFDELWIRELRARAPIVIFLLVPLFTAIMKLLYVRQKRFYVEHFVFALHVHSFVFFTMTLMVLLSRWTLVDVLLGAWIVVYIWISMRRVYQQGRLITTVKFFVLSQVYMVLALTAVVAMAAFTFFFAPV